jgi:hypothetical protein
MSKAESGPSRRSALSMIAGSVPAVAITSAFTAEAQTPTPGFLAILTAKSAALPHEEAWSHASPLSPEWDEASQRVKTADEVCDDLIRKYIADAMANPTWRAVGELVAIYRLEWWDEDGISRGEATDPWLAQAVFALVEKMSGLSDADLRRTISQSAPSSFFGRLA